MIVILLLLVLRACAERVGPELCDSAECSIAGQTSLVCRESPCQFANSEISGTGALASSLSIITPTSEKFVVSAFEEISLSNLRLLEVTEDSGVAGDDWFKLHHIVVAVAGSLIVDNVVVSRRCTDVLVQQEYLCQLGASQAGAAIQGIQVLNKEILVESFVVNGTRYTNTSFQCNGAPGSYTLPCAQATASSGPELRTALELSDITANVTITVTSHHITFEDPTKTQYAISGHVRVYGDPSLERPPQLNMNPTPGRMDISLGRGGRLSLNGLDVFGLVPSSTYTYPEGMMSFMMWGVGFFRHLVGRPSLSQECLDDLCLEISNCHLHISADELDFLFSLVPALSPGGDLTNTWGPHVPFKMKGQVSISPGFQLGSSGPKHITFPRMLSSYPDPQDKPSWVFEDVTLVSGEGGDDRQSVFSNILLPSEQFPIPWFAINTLHQSDQSLQWDFLTSSAPEVIDTNTQLGVFLKFRDTHKMVLKKLTKLNRTAPNSTLDFTFESDVLLIGDPFGTSEVTLDLGLSTPTLPYPAREVNGSQSLIRGYITIAPDAVVYVRSLTFANLNSVVGLWNPAGRWLGLRGKTIRGTPPPPPSPPADAVKNNADYDEPLWGRKLAQLLLTNSNTRALRASPERGAATLAATAAASRKLLVSGPGRNPSTLVATTTTTAAAASRKLLQGGLAPPTGAASTLPGDDAPPLGVDGGNNMYDSQDLAELLGNFTSPMWLFNMKRSVTSSSRANYGTMYLTNVTLIIPALELQVMRELILFNATSVNIDPDAKTALIHELAGPMKNLAQLNSSVVDRICGEEPRADEATPPDIVFPTYNWFGVHGEHITFSARAIEGVIKDNPAGVITPVGQSYVPCPPDSNKLVGSGLNSTDTSVTDEAAGGAAMNKNNVSKPDDGPPGPKPRPQPKYSSDEDTAPWVIGVIVAAAVCAVSLLAIAIFAFVKHRRKRKAQNTRDLTSFASSSLEELNLGSKVAATTSTKKDTNRHSNNTVDSSMPGGNTTGPMARMGTRELISAIFKSGEFAASESECLSHAGAGSGLCSPTTLGNASRAGLLEGGTGGEKGGSGSGPSAFPMHGTGSGDVMHLRLAMQRQLDDLSVGEEQQFEVHSQLGKGAFGVVYKGTWRGLEVAIKRIIFQLLSGAEGDAGRATALREAAINASLNHPNIVTTYSYDMKPLSPEPGPHMGGESSGDSNKTVPNTMPKGLMDWQLYIIQELCERGSLLNAFEEMRFFDTQREIPKLDMVLAIAEDIASGMAYIHSRNIIHGDLKPDNVLLKRRPLTAASGNATTGPPPMDCVAKVADFGLSLKMQGNQTHVSGVCHGTPLYIAPEILENGKASKSADVYSYGIMLWELFFGSNAWQHHVQNGGGQRGGRSAYYSPGLFTFDDCSVPYYAALGKACISQDPQDRPSFDSIARGIRALRAAPKPELVEPVSMPAYSCCSLGESTGTSEAVNASSLLPTPPPNSSGAQPSMGSVPESEDLPQNTQSLTTAGSGFRYGDEAIPCPSLVSAPPPARGGGQLPRNASSSIHILTPQGRAAVEAGSAALAVLVAGSAALAVPMAKLRAEKESLSAGKVTLSVDADLEMSGHSENQPDMFMMNHVYSPSPARAPE